MTGPEHYQEAERLLEELWVSPRTSPWSDRSTRWYAPMAGQLAAVTEGARLKLETAAVHAQLAQVALAYDALPDGIRREEEWARATRGY